MGCCLYFTNTIGRKFHEFDVFLDAEGFYLFIRGEYHLDFVQPQQFSRTGVFYCFLNNPHFTREVIQTCKEIYDDSISEEFCVHGNEAKIAQKFVTINGCRPFCFGYKDPKEFDKRYSPVIKMANQLKADQQKQAKDQAR